MQSYTQFAIAYAPQTQNISAKGVWNRVPKSHLWRRHWTAFKGRSPPMRCTSAINFNLDRIIMTIFGEGRQISADGIGVLASLKRIPFIREIWIISFARHWINAWVQISKNCNQFKLIPEICNSTHPGYLRRNYMSCGRIGNVSSRTYAKRPWTQRLLWVEREQFTLLGLL